MAATVGAIVARGSRSTVRELGTDAVVKVPLPGTPDAWIRYDAEYSSSARRAGAPVPEFLGFVEHEGRTSSVYRRARGPVMLQAIVDEPGALQSYAARLAELQLHLTTLVPPVTVPSFADRVRCKVRLAGSVAGVAVADVLAAQPTDGREVLCHGDLHPGNIILTADGPVLVDWFDAGRGDPLADVARSTLLIAPDADGDRPPRHLPGGSAELRQVFNDAYLAALGDLDTDRLARWRAVLAIARVAEGVPSDGLIAIWRSWARAGDAERPGAGQRVTSTS